MIVLPLRSMFARFLSVCFWMLLIFLFLFSPRVINKFVTEKSISIFTFPKLIDAQHVAKFEKETGIKLYINYYENNDELLVKMKKTGGKGYDIVIPSDYAVDLLKKDGLIQKIDKSKLDFLDQIDPRLIGHYFDPHNDYSIPYLWEISTIGINKNFFTSGLPEPSWKLIFDQQVAPKRICMNNNAREAILLAAFYLFGKIDNLTKEQLKKVKALLIKQKKWVEAYTDLRTGNLLATETCPVAVGMSDEIWQDMRFDQNLDLLIPKEGSFLVIDSIVVSAKSKKQDYIYKLINYLYRQDVMSHHADKYSLFPATKNVVLPKYFTSIMDRVWKEAKKLEFFKNVLSESQLNDIWIRLKAN